MNPGRLCQIISKSDKEISGYGQLVQHVIFAYDMVRQTPLIAFPPLRFLAEYHGSAIRMEHFALSVNKTLERVTHFLLDCSYFKQNFLSLWRNSKLKIAVSNQADGVNICQFIDNLDRHHKVSLLLKGLCLPFDNVTNMLIKRFLAPAVGKIHKLRREKLRELEAPWLTKK